MVRARHRRVQGRSRKANCAAAGEPRRRGRGAVLHPQPGGQAAAAAAATRRLEGVRKYSARRAAKARCRPAHRAQNGQGNAAQQRCAACEGRRHVGASAQAKTFPVPFGWHSFLDSALKKVSANRPCGIETMMLQTDALIKSTPAAGEPEPRDLLRIRNC